jgi:hypothetical protein
MDWDNSAISQCMYRFIQILVFWTEGNLWNDVTISTPIPHTFTVPLTDSLLRIRILANMKIIYFVEVKDGYTSISISIYVSVDRYINSELSDTEIWSQLTISTQIPSPFHDRTTWGSLFLMGENLGKLGNHTFFWIVSNGLKQFRHLSTCINIDKRYGTFRQRAEAKSPAIRRFTKDSRGDSSSTTKRHNYDAHFPSIQFPHDCS